MVYISMTYLFFCGLGTYSVLDIGKRESKLCKMLVDMSISNIVHIDKHKFQTLKCCKNNNKAAILIFIGETHETT